MILTIDLEKIERKALNLNQYLLLLKMYHLHKGYKLDFEEKKGDYFILRDLGYITLDGVDVFLTEKALAFIEGKNKRNYEELAKKIRDLFPKGLKSGKYPWRSSVQELAFKLQKLDRRMDMSDYSDEKIIRTVDKYINSFNRINMDSGMQISKYFIEKDNSSTLMDLLLAEESDSNKLSFMKKI